MDAGKGMPDRFERNLLLLDREFAVLGAAAGGHVVRHCHRSRILRQQIRRRQCGRGFGIPGRGCLCRRLRGGDRPDAGNGKPGRY